MSTESKSLNVSTNLVVNKDANDAMVNNSIPQNEFPKLAESEITKKKKKKRKNHSQLGKDFVAPDGKWGDIKKNSHF